MKPKSNANDSNEPLDFAKLLTDAERSQIEDWCQVMGQSFEAMARQVVEKGIEAVRTDINSRLLNESLISRHLEPKDSGNE